MGASAYVSRILSYCLCNWCGKAYGSQFQLLRDLDVVPDLVMSGALQHIDHLGVDWTRCCVHINNIYMFFTPSRDNYTDVALVNELSSAMETLSRFGKDRRLLRTTEVAFPKDIILYNCFQDKSSGLPSTLFPSFIVRTIAIPFSNPFLLRLSTWKMNRIRISKYRIHIALNKLAYHTSILGCLGKQFQICRRGESVIFHIPHY